jgi:hypothetical protein
MIKDCFVVSKRVKQDFVYYLICELYILCNNNKYIDSDQFTFVKTQKGFIYFNNGDKYHHRYI